MGIQWDSTWYTWRLQERLWFTEEVGLCNIPTEFGILMKLQVVRLIKCVGTKNIIRSEKTKLYTRLVYKTGQHCNTYISVKSSENVAKFKYLGVIQINENSIHEGIMSRFNSRNSCQHSTQNLLSSNLPCKNTKININIIILPTVLYGCETQFLSLWRKQALGVPRIGCWGK